jgi:hypothetical protein
MSKVTVSKESDYLGNPMIVLRKKKGKINMREAYEALEKEHMHGHYLLCIPVPEDVPFELYEEGDTWDIYEVDTLLDEKAEERFNEGYEACMRDYKLDNK